MCGSPPPIRNIASFSVNDPWSVEDWKDNYLWEQLKRIKLLELKGFQVFKWCVRNMESSWDDNEDGSAEFRWVRGMIEQMRRKQWVPHTHLKGITTHTLVFYHLNIHSGCFQVDRSHRVFVT